MLYPRLDTMMIEPLNDTEKRLLILCGAGLSNKRIADVLAIAVQTVEKYLTNVYGKLHASNRANAIFLAWYYGQLSPHEMMQCAEFIRLDGNGT